MEDKDRYSARIFLNAVIPLWKEIILRTSLAKSIKGQSGIVQISVQTDEGIWGTHFLFNEGQIQTKLGLAETKPDVELHFKDIKHFNAFFLGTTKKLPKITGVKRPKLLLTTFMGLLKMASTLSVKTAPAKREDQELLALLMIYLLPAGISTLNKQGHPQVAEWAGKSPDRVYAWKVDGYPEIASYIRVKAGNSRSARGAYTRSKPFFTMRFADLDAALGTLLQTDDLLEATAQSRLIMEGAPEFGAKIGDFMLLVASYTLP